jgi:hypothetical protein
MELRHLRYFTAVVQWKGYREASRHLYITQPSISEAVSDLESELGIKLLSRDGRVARLTPEGQVFYEEAIKTLAQAERSVATAQRAAKGEIGRLGIGFIGFASYPFLSDLLRRSPYCDSRRGFTCIDESLPARIREALYPVNDGLLTVYDGRVLRTQHFSQPLQRHQQLRIKYLSSGCA